LEFRLTWQGQLLAETQRSGDVRRSRAEHKQQIRKDFHPQLRRIWKDSPFLSHPKAPTAKGGDRIFGTPSFEHSIAQLAERFSMFNYHFVPLATRDLDVLCSIDILFLRLGEPGGLIRRTGDVDNRLKTIFDALCMPRDANQLGPFRIPGEDEDPFFCLLEDDSLITKATVETDTLWQPTSNPPNPNDVRLIITVRIRPGRINADNVGFG
jgi:hypothetical protein